MAWVAVRGRIAPAIKVVTQHNNALNTKKVAGGVCEQSLFTCADDDDLGLCVLHDGLNLRGCQTPIQAGEDGANLVTGIHQLKTLGAVFG